jgi:hypothetical protein
MLSVGQLHHPKQHSSRFPTTSTNLIGVNYESDNDDDMQVDSDNDAKPDQDVDADGEFVEDDLSTMPLDNPVAGPSSYGQRDSVCVLFRSSFLSSDFLSSFSGSRRLCVCLFPLLGVFL